MLSGKNLEERLIIQNSCTAYDVFTRIDGQAMSYDTDYFNQEEIDFLRKLFKNPRAKPDGTKMFCSAFLNDARMCCFFANAIVKY